MIQYFSASNVIIMRRNFWMKQSSRQENILYLVMWTILFVSPILSMYVSIVSGDRSSFEWQDLWFVWQRLLVFLALFLVHNFLLAPILVNHHRRWLYFSLMAVIVGCFVVYQCTSRPNHPGDLAGQRSKVEGKRPEMEEPPMGPRPEGLQGEARPDEPPMEPRPEGLQDGQRPDEPPMEPRPKEHEVVRTPQASGVPEAPAGTDLRPARGPKHEHIKPPVIMGEHDIVATVILILMFGMNLGMKAYFKSRNDQKKLAELEKQNMEQQLEYLKYQINPHFFMNTLNNIHALVDIDPAKAQETILELSKMMRFVLYEGDKNGVPLSREMEFIRTYVSLMRLRYTDKVTISLELPTEVPDKTVPPLMLISFVENAFKHGVSYQHPSFIYIKVEVEQVSSSKFQVSGEEKGQKPRANSQKLIFTCHNSKAEKPNQEKGGMGLQNVKKRLQLLYDDNYTLNIQDNPETYQVELIIPLT